MSPAKVLIAGVSTRAAAESAAQAGFVVTAVDAFGDLDQHPSVQGLSLAHNFTARAAALAAQTVECDAVVYLSSFENHPHAITMLAEGRALWGNSPETVRRVRDPLVLNEALRRRGFCAPEVRRPDDTVRLKPDTTPDTTVRLKPETTYVEDTINQSDAVSGLTRTVNDNSTSAWIVKPLASGGGRRIRLWDGRTSLPRGCYLQEFIDGPPGSVVFVAAAGRAVALGVSRQLVGEPAFGAKDFSTAEYSDRGSR